MASDSDGEVDFVSYGTPLEPLEEDEPLRKPIPLHEQTVKDEKGRYQRFHGAFTGGFSAGYFNTVGTKEGWTPSTFVSSRQQKAEKHKFRPEDFMDEEDFGEHGIAPKQITTSQEFSSSRRDEAQEKARAVNAQAALIPGDTLLEELIAPARSSIGVELLRKMGWKEGQGVGPRVKRKASRQHTVAGAQIYGCALPPAGSEDSEEEDEEEFAPENVTFAPKDVTPVDFTPRTGLQGLGYHGLDPRLALGRGASEHIDLFRPQSNSRSQLFGEAKRGLRRGGVVGQAFGVGALEDEDEDVYHRDSMSKYDTVLGGEEPGDGLYGWTAPQQYTKKRDSSKDASYLGKILEGFTLAQKSAEEKMIFPPPTLPRDFRPVHHFRPVVNVTRLSGVSPALAEALRTSKGHMVKEEPQQGQGGRHQLDSGQRRVMLGEETLQGPSSVLELLRPADRERLINLRTASKLPPTKTTAPEFHDALRPTPAFVGQQQQQQQHQQKQQQQEALAVWKGQTSAQTFKPFDKNPSKQARYELYLSRLKQGDKDALEQSLDLGMTEWERSREREEFVRACILYRPSSSLLSSRFTSAKHEEDDDSVEVVCDQEGDLDDKQKAVKMKMFGKLTRETFEWHPDKLLCKRFNVPEPYPGSGIVGLPKVKRDKFSVFNFLSMTESSGTTAPPKAPESSKKSRWDVSREKEESKNDDPLGQLITTARTQTSDKKLDQSATPILPTSMGANSHVPRDKSEAKSEEPKVDEKTEGDEEEKEEESRPPMDLFKAIFASSSDEKSSSSEGESEEEDEVKKEVQAKVNSGPLNLFNITSAPPSSVSIVSSSSVTPISSSSLTSVTPSSVTPLMAVTGQPRVSCQTTLDNEEFGPKLPPPSAAPFKGGGASMPGLPRKRNKEKKHKNKKQHKHKKDKKNKKHKKHKHKGKQQQKKSKKETSDSSSEDSDDDNDGDTATKVSADDLLKRLKSIRSQQT